MTFPQACQYLHSFINYEAQLDQLSVQDFPRARFQKLLKALGHPEKRFKALHVAGTKGKGFHLRVFGAGVEPKRFSRWKLYTSPHLLEVPGTNCYCCCGSKKFITRKDFGAVLQRMQAALEKLRQDKRYGSPTYFEVLTALSGEWSRSRSESRSPGAWSRRPGRIRPEACGGNEGRPATILN